MGCNPEEGDLQELTPDFTREKAFEQGYTEIFSIGETIRIKNCYFEVNNFVPEHNFMNLKLLKNEEALERLSQMIPKGEDFRPEPFRPE